MDAESPEGPYSDFDIAIIGMAGRFPKARNIDEYWQNLVDGTDCVTWFSRDELLESGVEPALVDDPNYVPAAPVLENADHFDAEFFGYSPKEAKGIDPQQRQLLECGYLALENSGYDPGSYDGRIGVFAGTAMNTYFINTGLNRQFNVDYLPTLLGNDKDFLATRISYKLGLQGPALTVQTACSSSLVAIHYATQSLLSGESDMALVAAAAVRVPLATGHLYEEASVFTKDGKCRAFDAEASGTIFGSGVGGVVLKSAKRALEDGDNIRAIIRGSAINNDGNEKSDFTAPSVSMQAAAITEAMAAADVEAESIDYVEAHGTGTYLGDPIEVAALTQAYSAETDKTGYCKIGSVKSNVGHLDAAAGMASLIKVVLSLENGLLPKTLHFSKPNPQIGFETTPFEPAAENTPWTRGDRPRRAGITSLGMGGTNAHIIVEEAQPVGPISEGGTGGTNTANSALPLTLTARTKGDLDNLSEAIGQHLAEHDDLSVADVAATLAARAPQQEKRFVYGSDRESLIEALTTKASPLTADITGVITTTATADDAEDGVTAAPTVPVGDTVFLFTGQGSQRVGMGRGLYESSPVFKDAVDRCAELFQSHIDVDIRTEMWAPEGASKEQVDAAQARLAETWLTQPTLFTIEYALAQWWISEGVTPTAMLGHSIGELTAAAVAEIMSLEDAIHLVSVRATSMFEAQPGAMVAIEADEETIKPLLGLGASNGADGKDADPGIEIAVQNGAKSLVLAGTFDAVAALTAELDKRDMAYRELRTSHAFHTATMDSAAAKVAEVAASITMSEPKIPVISNISGDWYSSADRADDQYWARQVRAAVRFADGLDVLLTQTGPGQDAEPGQPRAFIELGPAATITGLVTAHEKRTGRHQVRSTLPPRTGQLDDLVHAQSTKAWLQAVGGVPADPSVAAEAAAGRQVELPGYPFTGKRFWYTAPDQPAAPVGGGGLSGHDLRSRSSADWAHVESFAPAAGSVSPTTASALIVGASSGQAQNDAAQWLAQLGPTMAPTTISTRGDGRWTADSFKAELSALEGGDGVPGRIIYWWNDEDPTDQTVELMAIARALTGWDMAEHIDLLVITEDLIDPLQGAGSEPSGAMALGPVRVINAEMETISARLIDVGAGANASTFESAVAATDSVVHVLRHELRWTPQYVRANLPAVPAEQTTGRKVALVGGFGGIGMELARRFVAGGDSVVLTSTRAVSDDHRAAIAELGDSAQAATLSLDDKSSVTNTISGLADSMGGLDLIVHLGGVLDNALLAQKEPESARAVLQPKVDGSLQLLAAAEATDSQLVLLSSIAATHPEPGQVDYSAATAFQAALARSEDRVRAIAYPAWTGVGMTNQLSADGQAKAAVSGIASTDAVDAFEQFLASDLASVIISPIPLEHLGLARSAPTGSAQSASAASATTSSVALEGLTPTEQKLAAIWNQLLGHDEIAPEDQFIELGGTSLMAVKMFTQIDRQFGVELPVETVLEAPSLAELAAVLEAHGAGVSAADAPANNGSAAASNGSASGNGSSADNGSNGAGAGASAATRGGAVAATAAKIAAASAKPKIRVRVRPGSGAPLYLVHAHGGTVLSYERLARHLRADIDVNGFQSQGIDGVAEPLTTISDMADLYIAELKDHQPEGPYHIGGFCMGGTIAWEMAAKLVEQGEEVSNLFMIQAFNREYPQYPPDMKQGWISRLTKDQLSLARLDDEGGEIDEVGTKAKANALARGVKSKAYTTLLRLAEPVSTGRRTTLNRIGRINDQAFWDYPPRKLSNDVTYLPATIQPEGAIEDHTLGFAPFHDGPSSVRVVGGHFQGRFVEMDLEAIAEEINNRISE